MNILKWFRAGFPLIVACFILPMASPESAAKSETDFYRELQKKPVATNEDSIRAVARFIGYRGAENAEAEVAYVRANKVKIRRNMLQTLRGPVRKGEAANLFLNAMGHAADNRGLFGRLFSGSRRFAARDAMAQKLLPPDSFMNEFMTGGDLLAMLARAREQAEEKR